MTETIFALSTPRGRSAIAVLRLTGPHSAEALRLLTGRVPQARRATLARIMDTAGDLIDTGLVLWLPGPKSFTGEDMAEFQVHGSPAIVSGLVDALAALPGFHPAEPGAFTRRAFENGRLDLTAVEGMADLIAAETAAQRRQALRHLQGHFGALVEEWRNRLVRLMVLAEAEIDFPEDDLPEGLLDGVRVEVVSLRGAIGRQLADAGRGERLRSGFQVALVGPPNVGKSTLLNALARRDVAIVADEPGTTRDILEVHLDLGGYPVTLLDMAGLRDNPGTVEALGIARALRRSEDADLRIFLIEAGTSWSAPPYRESARLCLPGDVIVRSKCDRLTRSSPDEVPSQIPAFSVSAHTGDGLSELLKALQGRVSEALAPEGEAPAVTRARHRRGLENCCAALDRLLAIWTEPAELRAEELRLAARALGEITGRVDVEDILDGIFSTFCIGK